MLDLITILDFSFAFTCFSLWCSVTFVCFSKAFSKVESLNLVGSVIWLWLDGNISLPPRYSYLVIFLDDNADISTAFLIVLYCSFSSLILSSIVASNFYILLSSIVASNFYVLTQIFFLSRLKIIWCKSSINN